MSGPSPLVVKDARALARRAAERVVEITRAAVAARGSARVALAGGSTPRATYEVLAGSALSQALPWGAVLWFFGDERAVPPSDPESNYRLAAETLFAGRPEALARAHRMRAEAEDAHAAAREYEALLPERLDLLLLGMGEDGHTASLFPGSAALGEREARVVPSVSPRPPRGRLTITPPVIASAREVVVLVAGEAKAEVLARVLEGPLDTAALPVQLARERTFLVDAAAARRLTRRD
jgi:6-phosphogluconolactonase